MSEELRRYTREEMIARYGFDDIEQRCNWVAQANKRVGEPLPKVVVLDTDDVLVWRPERVVPTGVLWAWSEKHGLHGKELRQA